MVAAALRIASRAGLPPALACTVLISSLLHAALMVVPLPSGTGPRQCPHPLPVLQARAARAACGGRAGAGHTPHRPERLRCAARNAPLLPSMLRAATPVPPPDHACGAGRHNTRPRTGCEQAAMPAMAAVSAEPLVDMSRLGDPVPRANRFPRRSRFPFASTARSASAIPGGGGAGRGGQRRRGWSSTRRATSSKSNLPKATRFSATPSGRP